MRRETSSNGIVDIADDVTKTVDVTLSALGTVTVSGFASQSLFSIYGSLKAVT